MSGKLGRLSYMKTKAKPGVETNTASKVSKASVLRTASAETEYPKVKSTIRKLTRSLREVIKWAVFEPNNEVLWTEVRGKLDAALLQEWRSGSLVGVKPEQAFFAKCDRSTMTQADVDRGRLICLIGVAVLRPAEFVLLRIGQWTASRRQRRPRKP